jgi:hypothetical protein
MFRHASNKYVWTQRLLKGKKKKRKAIPVTGRQGPQGCERSRLPHFV